MLFLTPNQQSQHWRQLQSWHGVTPASSVGIHTGPPSCSTIKIQLIYALPPRHMQLMTHIAHAEPLHGSAAAAHTATGTDRQTRHHALKLEVHRYCFGRLSTPNNRPITDCLFHDASSFNKSHVGSSCHKILVPTCNQRAKWAPLQWGWFDILWLPITSGCREGWKASIYTYKHGSIQFLTVESVDCWVLAAE